MRERQFPVRFWTSTHKALLLRLGILPSYGRAFFLSVLLLTSISCTEGVPELQSLGLELPGPSLIGLSEVQVNDDDQLIVLQGEYDSRFREIQIEAPKLSDVQIFSVTSISIASDEPTTKQFRIEKKISDWIDFTGKPPGTIEKIKIYGVTKIGKSLPTEISFVYNPTGPSATIATSPASFTNDPIAIFTFTGSAQTLSFQCSLDGGVYAACTSPYTTAALGEGIHSFDIKGVDADGLESTPNTHSWTVDTVAPSITIAAPLPSATTAPVITLTGSCEASLPITVTGDISGVTTPVCSSGSFIIGATLTAPDGAKNITLTQSDAAGNSNTASISLHRDGTPPVLTLDSPATNTAAQAGLIIAGTCDISMNVFISGDVTAMPIACMSSAYSQTVTFTAGDGAKTVTVTQTDAVGNATVVSRVFVRDNSAPSINITSTPASISNSPNANFVFTATDPNGPILLECQIDGGPFNSCTSPFAANGLSDGARTFGLRATDAAGNTSAVSSYAWAIDTSAPAISFTSPAASTLAQTGLTIGGSCETGLLVNLSGSGLLSPSSASCVAGTFSVAIVFTAGEGPKNISISQTDAASNTSADSRQFVRDNTLPLVQIDAQPLVNSNSTTANFDFSGSDANGVASYACELDGGGFSACTSTRTYNSLSESSHTFKVHSIDLASNISSDATYTWTVDTTGPSAFAISGFTGGTDSIANIYLTNLVPTVNWNTASGALYYDVVIKDSAGTVNICGPQNNVVGTNFNFAPCSLADNTTYRAYVTARDSAGNATTASNDGLTIVVDTTNPTSTCGGISSFVSVNSATASPGCNDTAGGAGCAATECRIDGGAFGASCSFSSLSEGSHNVEVRSTDLAGNVQSSSFGSCAFTVDTIIPIVAIDTNPGDPSSNASPSFTFSGGGTGTGVEHFECKLDGGSYVACTSPKNLVGLTDGSHTFYVKSFDQAGNSSLESTYTWTINTVGPGAFALSGFTGPSDATPDLFLGDAQPTISWTAATGAVSYSVEVRQLDGTTVVCGATNGTSPFTFPGCSLTNGTYRVYITATNALSVNTAMTSNGQTFTVDLTDPTSSCVGVSGFVALNSVTATPGCSDASSGCSSTQCRIDGGAFGASCAFSSLSEGAHSIEVRAIDIANNQQSAGFGVCSFTVDTVIPTVTITGQPANPNNQTNAGFSFSNDGTGSSIVSTECKLDAGAFSACDTFSSHGFPGPLSQGSHTFTVRVTDQAGLVSANANYNWTIDTTPPLLAFTSPATNSWHGSSVDVTGSCDDTAGMLTFTGDGSVAPVACAPGGTFSATLSLTAGDGVKTVNVNQTDVAGNLGSTSRNFQRDSTPPSVSLTGQPNSTTNATLAIFLFNGSDGAGSQINDFLCSVDGSAFSSCVTATGYSVGIGPHTFSLVAVDLVGNITATPVTHSWTVVANSSPVAVADGVLINQDAAATTVNVLANDIDPNSDPLTVSAKTNGAHGTVTIAGDSLSVTYTPDAGYHGTDTFTYTANDGQGGTNIGTVNVKVMNPYTWDGGGGNANWNTPANWHDNVVPTNTAGQIAIFDGTCSSNCSPHVAANTTVYGIEISPDYAQTIIQDVTRTLTVGAGGWKQDAGTFTGSNAVVTINGDFTLNGGTFNATSANISINGHFVLNSGTFTSTVGTLQIGRRFFVDPSATFNHNSGTVSFQTVGEEVIEPNNAILSTVRFDGSSRHAEINGILRVTNHLNIGTGQLGVHHGTIHLSGNLFFNGSTGTMACSDIGACANLTTIRFIGTNQTINASNAGSGLPGVSSNNLPSIEIQSAGSVTISGSVGISGNITQTSGSLLTTASVVRLNPIQNVSYDLFPSTQFEDLYISSGNFVQIGIVGPFSVTNDLMINNVYSAQTINGSYIQVAGDLFLDDTGSGGSLGITLNGSGPQYISQNFGTMFSGPFTIDSTGTVFLQSGLTVQDLNHGNGELQTLGYGLTVTGTYFTGLNARLRLNGIEPISIGTRSLDPYSEVIYDGGGSYGNLAFGNNYQKLRFVGSGSYTHSGNLSARSIEIANGSLTSAGNITVSEMWDNQATYNHGGNTVTFTGAANTLRGDTTFFNLSKVSAVSETISFQDASVQNVLNNLTLQGAAGQLLTLNSTTPGVRWNINATGTRNISYVSVEDSDNIAPEVMQVATSSASDSGNNDRWNFSDLTYPTAPTVALRDSVTNSNQYTNQMTVVLEVSPSADHDKTCVIVQDSGAAAPSTPLYNSGCWMASAPSTVNLVFSNATTTAYVFVMDTNQLVSGTTASISHSNVAPPVPTLTLNDPTTNSTNYIRQTTTNITATGTGFANWCVQESPATPSALDPCWTSPTNYSVSSGDGSKTIYLFVRNLYGNVNSVSNSIYLDETLPTVGGLNLSDPRTSSSSYTNEQTITASMFGPSGDVASWYIADVASGNSAPTAPVFNTPGWTTGTLTSYTLSSNGPRDVYLWVKDNADNVSMLATTALIDYSAATPDPTLSMTLSDPGSNSIAGYTNNTYADLALANYGSPRKFCISETQSTKPNFGTDFCNGGSSAICTLDGQNWCTTLPTGVNLSGGDGNHTVYYYVADAYNNVSILRSETINRDTTAPLTVSGVSDGTTFSSVTDTPHITWSALAADGGSAIANYEISIGSGIGGTDRLGWTDVGLSTQYDGTGLTLTPATTYYVNVRARDSAGNIGPYGSSDGWIAQAPGGPTLSDFNVNLLNSTSTNIDITSNVSVPSGWHIDSISTPSHGTVSNITASTFDFNAPGFHGLSTFTVTITDNGTNYDSGIVKVYLQTSFTWTGYASNDWNDPANWGGSVPGPSDVALFDDTCTSNCSPTIAPSGPVGGIDIGPGYPGTLTQGNPISIGSSGFVQQGGIFQGSALPMTVTGMISLQGGTFTAPSSLEVRGGFHRLPGNTFNHNNGLVILDGASAVQTLNLNSTPLYNLELRGTYALSFAGSATIVNDLNLNGFRPFNGATLNVGGTLYANSFDGGSGTIRINGAGNQSIVGTTGARLPNFEIASTAGTVILSGTLQVDGNWTHTSGSIDSASSTVKFTGSSVSVITSAGTVFNNISFDKNSADISLSGFLRGNNVTINNVGGQINGSTLYVNGDLSLANGSGGGSSIVLEGTSTQTIAQTSGRIWPGGSFTINKTGGMATVASDLVFSNAGADFIVQSGTISIADFDISVPDQFQVQSGTTVNIGGNSIIAGTRSIASGSTVIITTTSSGLPLGNTYGSLAISAPVALFNNIIVNNNLSISPGATLNAGAYNISIAGNWSNIGTFNPGTGTVNFTGAAQTISGANTFNNFTKNAGVVSTLTFQNATTQTINGNLTLNGASIGARLSLRSTAPGVQWRINPSGTRTVSFLDVQDSNNVNGTIINAGGTNSISSGNNTNWNFAADSNPPTFVGWTTPIEDSYFSSGPINFSWQQATDAESGMASSNRYRVELYNTLNCSGGIVAGPFFQMTTTYSTGFTNNTVYSLRVTSYDAVGNSTQNCSPNIYADNLPPSVSITTGPAQGSTAYGRTATFAFTATDAGGSGLDRFECAIDGGPGGACTSPLQLNGLSDGAHTLDVVSFDRASNVSTMATRNWTVSQAGAPDPYVILGVRGGSDVTYDGFLTTLTTPDVSWSTTTAGQFVATIYNMDMTVQCTSPNVFAYSYTFTGCTLTNGYSYKIHVVSVGQVREASNNFFKFTVGSASNWSPIDDGLAPRMDHTAVWTGKQMIVWGGRHNGQALKSGAIYDATTDSWTPTTIAGSPNYRFGHTATWISPGMFIWGGTDGGGFYNDGAVFSMLSKTWTSITPSGVARAGHTATLTDKEILFWGGYDSGGEITQGLRFDPYALSWAGTITNISEPTARKDHTAVWTGSKMIVWGGSSGTTPLSTGAQYNPDTDMWGTLAGGAPPARSKHSGIWTGREMIIWGGLGASSTPLDTGSKFNPITNTWNPTQMTNVPSARYGHTTVWTGNDMVVWGGYNGAYLNTGGVMSRGPVVDSWATLTIPSAPSARMNATGVWTGKEVIFHGGTSNGTAGLTSGAKLKVPNGVDAWMSVTTTSAPTPNRQRHSAVWTGSQYIVWGGCSDVSCSATINGGGRYDPVSDSWTTITTSGSGGARARHTAIWTGREMIIWGGHNGAAYITTTTGRRYDPIGNSWVSMVDGPTGREEHTAIWTGTRMIIHGGQNGAWRNDTHEYDPIGNSWPYSATANTNRASHTAVWTGFDMVVFGGTSGSGTDVSSANALQRYNPGGSWVSGLPIGVTSRSKHVMVWTGTEIIVWGGFTSPGGTYPSDGGRFNVFSSTWLPMSNPPVAFVGRANAAAVWTGQEMIIWGGYDGSTYPNTAQRYDPTTDIWKTVTSGGSGRIYAQPAWTGQYLLFWGGYNGSILGDGYRLSPSR